MPLYSVEFQLIPSPQFREIKKSKFMGLIRRTHYVQARQSSLGAGNCLRALFIHKKTLSIHNDVQAVERG